MVQGVSGKVRLVLRRALYLAAFALLLRTFVVEPTVVPTSSMEGTILVGDHLLLDKALYGPQVPFTSWRLPRLKSVRRGDVVVFRYPKDLNQLFVKRVVAVGGDEIAITDGVVMVNGSPVREPYAVHTVAVSSRMENMLPRRLTKGELFVLGDNRDNSEDSRFWGPLPERNVVAEPLMVFWSFDAPSAAWLDEQHRLRLLGSIAGNFFTHTRWGRTATLL